MALGVGSQDALRFNVAADCEINDDLSDLQLPAGVLTPDRFGFEPGQLAETYYVLLEGRSASRRACGSGAHGVSQPWDLGGPDHRAIDEVEAELIRQQVATDIRQAMQGASQIPDGLARWARAFLRPVVDWRRELRAQIRAGLSSVSGGVDYSYNRPSRRSGTPIGRAVILPALVQPLPTVAVVVDTSASMSEPSLERVLAEIKGLLQSVGAARTRLAVLACDMMVRTTQAVFSASQVQLSGGGGTDMRVGIDAAFSLRPRPDLVVVATDGYTPWPGRRPDGIVAVALIGDGPAPPGWARFVRVPVTGDRAG
jgi:predicted metal-dependent peptidase